MTNILLSSQKPWRPSALGTLPMSFQMQDETANLPRIAIFFLIHLAKYVRNLPRTLRLGLNCTTSKAMQQCCVCKVTHWACVGTTT